MTGSITQTNVPGYPYGRDGKVENLGISDFTAYLASTSTTATNAKRYIQTNRGLTLTPAVVMKEATGKDKGAATTLPKIEGKPSE